MILNDVGIGQKEDGVGLASKIKKVVIARVVNQKKYVSIVIIGHHNVIVVVKVVQYVMNMLKTITKENFVDLIILNHYVNFVNYP